LKSDFHILFEGFFFAYHVKVDRAERTLGELRREMPIDVCDVAHRRNLVD
jgi:hypothetical protein